MKIAVSAVSNDLEQQVNPVFGRCQGFLIIETKGKKIQSHKFIANSAINAVGGAGIAAAQTVASQGIEAVISGSMGPNAFMVLQQSGIKMFQGTKLSIKEAVEKLFRGELPELSNFSVPGHFGMGQGRGSGRGARGRRGRGPPM